MFPYTRLDDSNKGLLNHEVDSKALTTERSPINALTIYLVSQYQNLSFETAKR